MVRSSLCGDLIEGEAADGVTGAIAGPRLPAPNGCVEVLWIDLDAIASTAGSFCGDYGRAAALKPVEHEVTARRAVHNCIGD
jgi:hypothetical protein